MRRARRARARMMPMVIPAMALPVREEVLDGEVDEERGVGLGLGAETL